MSWTVQSGTKEYRKFIQAGGDDIGVGVTWNASCGAKSGFTGLLGGGHAYMRLILTAPAATDALSFFAVAQDSDHGSYRVQAKKLSGAVIDTWNASTKELAGAGQTVALDMSGNTDTTIALEISASGSFEGSGAVGVGYDIGVASGFCG